MTFDICIQLVIPITNDNDVCFFSPDSLKNDYKLNNAGMLMVKSVAFHHQSIHVFICHPLSVPYTAAISVPITALAVNRQFRHIGS